jgi:hypothetical protein
MLETTETKRETKFLNCEDCEVKFEGRKVYLVDTLHGEEDSEFVFVCGLCWARRRMSEDTREVWE